MKQTCGSSRAYGVSGKFRTLRRWAIVSALLAASAFSAGGADWRVALPGWKYQFDRDHFPHPDFKTEWWYFTGNLRAQDGQRFGYQLTFFRSGIRPQALRSDTHPELHANPAQPRKPHESSRFIVDDLKFAHFAMTDVGAKQFYYRQKLSRGAFGEAGFARKESAGDSGRIAWIDDWQLTQRDDGAFEIFGRDAFGAVSLRLGPGKVWTLHGENGVSQKAAGEGHASHYYSGTRLPTRGRVTIGGREYAVEGESWFDHEWATNQLAANQIGWNWFSIQLDDQTELMLYEMRTRDGGADPSSSGTFVDATGAVRHLRRNDYTLTATKFWTSAKTGGRYPIAWEVAIPSLDLRLSVSTPVENQELVLKPIAYWEGVIDVAGQRGPQAVRGHGYLELTGYAGELVGLSVTSPRAESPPP